MTINGCSHNNSCCTCPNCKAYFCDCCGDVLEIGNILGDLSTFKQAILLGMFLFSIFMGGLGIGVFIK